VKVLLLAHENLVPARLRGAHHRDGGVLVRLEPAERVDDEEQDQAICSGKP
jgi:hypothetical protein